METLKQSIEQLKTVNSFLNVGIEHKEQKCADLVKSLNVLLKQYLSLTSVVNDNLNKDITEETYNKAYDVFSASVKNEKLNLIQLISNL